MSVSPRIAVVGDPLLDLVVLDGSALVSAYGLESNDMTLAGPHHVPIYEDALLNHNPILVPGGDANIARAAAGDVAFIGSIGPDARGRSLIAANQREGVSSYLHIEPEQETGVCAVLIQNENRSLVTHLCAAHHFKPSYLTQPEVTSLLSATHHVYISGYFLSHGIESALEIVSIATRTQQKITLNLAAPFIVQNHTAAVDSLLPYADYVLGNASEAVVWAQINGLEQHDLPAIASALSRLPKTTPGPRTVIITNSADPTIVAFSSSSTPSSAQDSEFLEFPVPAVPTRDIVDTNGAGDCFAGGFLAALVEGYGVPEAVGVGQRLAAMCLGQIGAQLKWPKERDIILKRGEITVYTDR